MSGRIDPSTNRDTASTDTVGGPTAGDKYDDSRHLNYGQSKSSKSEDLGSPCPVPIRRHSISSDSKPVSMHTFQEQITGGMTVNIMYFNV
ncbi:7329_t:CDS:2 [Funneliformis geosporum]|uniref:7329_t:CDS:1 n=1 Tax=Funneliformis geosporum TaxID=1117311 RepID=A0A9W4WPZ5_9GLOM|nr:7329_t:CDS:2 [Funneliformis geosporum]